MKVRGRECPECGDFIWSKHRHNFVRCRCRKVAIDGGTDYIRMVREPFITEVREVQDNSEDDWYTFNWDEDKYAT